MKTKNIVFTIAIILSITYLFSQTKSKCNKLPSSFVSYPDAQKKIENETFLIHETTNTFRSSWIRDLHFYSCDGKTGFILLKAKGKVYIHQNVPIAIWNNLKGANSLGSYYSSYIRNKYELKMNR